MQLMLKPNPDPLNGELSRGGEGEDGDDGGDGGEGDEGDLAEFGAGLSPEAGDAFCVHEF